MEKGVLGKTRKYKNGSIHENASGKFMILDRYQGEDGKAWLKYQWLNGMSEGKVEENKEENINASLYKFKVSRGIKESIEMDDSEVVTPNQIFQLVEDNNRILNIFEDNRTGLINELKRLEDKVSEQQTQIEKLLLILNQNQKTMDMILTQTTLVNKLVDKL
jgi:hypothetical protein